MLTKMCSSRSGRHRWAAKLGARSLFRALSVFLEQQPDLRICGYCGARGRINKQGIVDFESHGALPPRPLHPSPERHSTMRILSLSQPWLWAVLHAGKHIENRKWQPTSAAIGQRIALHAAKSWDDIAFPFFIKLGIEHPRRREDYETSAILGVATIDRIVTDASSLPPDQARWFFGPFGWVLSDVRVLRHPIPRSGAQGLRHLEEAAERQVSEQLEAA